MIYFVDAEPVRQAPDRLTGLTRRSHPSSHITASAWISQST